MASNRSFYDAIMRRDADIKRFVEEQNRRYHPLDIRSVPLPLTLDEEIELVKKSIASKDPNAVDGNELSFERKLSKECLMNFREGGLEIFEPPSCERFRDREYHYTFKFREWPKF